MIVTLAFKKESSGSLPDKIKNKLIKMWTSSEYFHVEIIIKDRWISSSPSVGAVYENQLHERSTKYDYVDVNVNGRKLRTVQKFIQSQIGKKYDWPGIFFSQVINFDLDSRDKWFCSEIVAQILQIFGLDLSRPANEYSPGELYREVEKIITNKELDISK